MPSEDWKAKKGQAVCTRLGVPHALLRTAAWLTRRWFTAGSCAVVVNADDEVLLVRSRLRAGAWGLPGGFLKRRESPETALRRELAEELGLTGSYAVEAIDQYLQEHASHLEFLYRVCLTERFVAAPQDSVEVAEAGWFHPDQLPELLPEAVLALRKASQQGMWGRTQENRDPEGL